MKIQTMEFPDHESVG